MGARTSMKKAIKMIGKIKLSRILGVSYQSMNRWVEQNELPCTEYNGKTFYSRQIEHITKGKVTITDLLGFIPPPQADDENA